MCETVQSLMMAKTVELPFNVPWFEIFPHLTFDFSDLKSIILLFLHLWLSLVSSLLPVIQDSPYVEISLYMLKYVTHFVSTGKMIDVLWLKNLYISSKFHDHQHENFICYICSLFFCQSMLDICATVKWIQLPVTSVNVVLAQICINYSVLTCFLQVHRNTATFFTSGPSFCYKSNKVFLRLSWTVIQIFCYYQSHYQSSRLIFR